MDIWLQKEGAIPRIFVIIVVVGLWGKADGKFALFKWIFPFLSGDHITNDAFRIEDLLGIEFVHSMR